MTENRLRKRQPGAPQHARPNDAVKPDDVFTDDVHTCGPKIFVFGLLGPPRTGEIVCERVEPHVHDVFWGIRHWNTPIERRARYRQISKIVVLQARQNLVSSRRRLNKLRIRLNVRDELLLISALFEKVTFFLHLFQVFPTDWVFVPARLRFALRHKGFLAHVVPPLVCVQINVPAISRAPEQLCTRFLVHVARRAIVHVVRHVQSFVQVLELGHVRVHERQRRHPLLLRRLRYLLPVFVRTRLKQHLPSVRAMISRQDVGGDGFVRVSHVRRPVRVVDRRRHAKSLPSRVLHPSPRVFDRALCRARVIVHISRAFAHVDGLERDPRVLDLVRRRRGSAAPRVAVPARAAALRRRRRASHGARVRFAPRGAFARSERARATRSAADRSPHSSTRRASGIRCRARATSPRASRARRTPRARNRTSFSAVAASREARRRAATAERIKRRDDVAGRRPRAARCS